MLTNDIVLNRIGFGCGRLQGGTQKKSSLRLIHTALDVGIRHFDVAPSYGLGAAEKILGEALSGCTLPLTIATKVGIQRPQATLVLQALRTMLKPVARVIPSIRSVALKSLSSQIYSQNFTAEFIEKSFRESLILLKRSNVDFLLLHEPTSNVDFQAVTKLLDSFVKDDLIKSYGSSTGAPLSELISFGNISQYQCTLFGTDENSDAELVITHGVYRFLAPKIKNAVTSDAALYKMLVDVGVLVDGKADAFGALALAYALAHSRGKVLVSTNTSNRLVNDMTLLRQIVNTNNWMSSMSALNNKLLIS